MSTHEEIPLFPLGTVLFQGGRLPLRIFEPRYLGLVSSCMRASSGFGVVLIRQGREVHEKGAAAPTTSTIGTLAEIVDFDPLPNNRLGIVCRGKERFRIHRSWVRDDDILAAEVEFLADEQDADIEPGYADLVATLQELLKHPMVEKLGIEVDVTDARAVSWRLAELLPIDMAARQELLEMTSATERLGALQRVLAKLRGDGPDS